MSEKTATQANELYEAIEQMANGLPLSLLAHVMELLQKRQHFARDYTEHVKRWGGNGYIGTDAIAEAIRSINEKINEALLTKI